MHVTESPHPCPPFGGFGGQRSQGLIRGRRRLIGTCEKVIPNFSLPYFCDQRQIPRQPMLQCKGASFLLMGSCEHLNGVVREGL